MSVWLLLALACKPIGNDTVTSADDTDVTDTDTDGADTDTDVADTDTDTDTDVGDTDTTADADGDGYDAGVDCNDGDPDVHPGAEEVCGNGVDDDCDGGPGRCAFTGEHRVTDAAYELSGDRGGDEAGYRVVVGDFDGDGQPDLATGAPSRDQGDVHDAGAAYVVTGPITGDVDLWSGPAEWTGSTYRQNVGVSLAAGDLDGDGRDELVVGAPGLFPDYGTFDGVGGDVFVLTDPTAGGALSSTTALVRGTTDVAFGSDVAIGDVTGDGHPDVIVGARYSSAYADWGGAAYVFDDPASGGSVADAAATIYGVRSPKSPYYGLFGASVKAGDLDGDGIDDLVGSAPYLPDAKTGYAVGAVYVLKGPPAAVTTTDDADATLTGHYTQDGALWPTSLALPGDVDGDGLGDVLVGIPEETSVGDGARYQGAVYLVTGKQLTGDMDLFFATWKVAGPDGEWLGISVAGAGDVDGDGFADVLAGGVGDSTYGHAGGAARLWYGSLSGTGSLADADAAWYGTSDSDGLGQDVAVGDLTGDGVADLVFGAATRTSGATWSGSLFVVPATGF